MKFRLAALFVFAMPLYALAQTQAQPPAQGQGPANALQGFSKNRDQPVQIEASTLEVREKEKQATFIGNVKVTQGDTGLRSKFLVVFYEDDSKAAGAQQNMKAATPGPGGQQQIKRLEAKGGVVVTQKDQTVTGDLGVFDMRTNTVTMSGNVVMTQAQNVLRGERLVVDLTSGVSRVESKAGQGRVQGLFQAGSVGKSDDSTSRGNAPIQAIPAIPAPGQPRRLN
jgi:lipopolysaccharide export system protein LptA